MDRAQFQCEHCGAEDKTLHVHHKAYRKGAEPWEYADHELMVLCDQHHKEWHRCDEIIRNTMRRMSLDDIRTIAGLAFGLMAATTGEDVRSVWLDVRMFDAEAKRSIIDAAVAGCAVTLADEDDIRSTAAATLAEVAPDLSIGIIDEDLTKSVLDALLRGAH